MSLSPIYEQSRQETLTEGRQEGRREEWRSLAQKMLQAGATFEFVSQVTGCASEAFQHLLLVDLD